MSDLIAIAKQTDELLFGLKLNQLKTIHEANDWSFGDYTVDPGLPANFPTISFFGSVLDADKDLMKE